MTHYRRKDLSPRHVRIIEHYTLAKPNMNGTSRVQAVVAELSGEHADEMATLVLNFLKMCQAENKPV
jgi:hypothetical protein